jgi:Barstar (barnase inhibitor)
MDTRVVIIPAGQITDWDTLHDVFQKALGFPPYYGRNMNAWIDLMTYLDSVEDTSVTVDQGGIVILRIEDADVFEKRCPEQFKALLDCSAFVNRRRMETGEPPVLALMLCHRYQHVFSPALD